MGTCVGSVVGVMVGSGVGSRVGAVVGSCSAIHSTFDNSISAFSHTRVTKSIESVFICLRGIVDG